MKYLLETFKSYASTALQLILTLGVTVMFTYWSLVINFFPANITISESLLFIFAALMFGLFYSVWFLTALGATYGLLHILVKEIKYDSGLLIIGLACAVILSISVYTTGTWRVLAPVPGALLISIIIWHWKPLPLYTPPSEVKKIQQQKIFIYITAILIPIVIAPEITARIVSNSIKKLGFRHMDVSISLDESNQKIIKGVIGELGLTLYRCNHETPPEQFLHHVDVLWHGLGERTLIELPLITDDSDGLPYQVELNRSGVNLVRSPGDKGRVPMCFSPDSELLFDTYTSTLTPDGIASLNAFIEKINTYLKTSDRHITAITVIGHSDRNPVRSANDNNQSLSHRRAKEVATHLKTLAPELSITIKAAASHAPISKCTKDLSRIELNECLAKDRRVEIMVQTRQQ